MVRIKSHVLIILFLSLIFTFCKNGTEPERKKAEVFEIWLESGFQNNSVQIEFDGNLVFGDTVSTDSIFLVGAIIPLDVIQGSHHLRVVVNTSCDADTTLKVGDSLYVAVNYNRNPQKIYFYAQTRPVMYR